MPRRAAATIGTFAARVIRWQEQHGRHGLPWQATGDAYRIWLSEIMLQQTQVAVVIPYYERFLARFPRVADLAAAESDEVMGLWSGLGYYARARNLHGAAREVMERHGGIFPSTYEAIAALPGIGRSTAGAIAAFASGERRAILDGNVRRVLARHAGVAGDPSSAAVLESLWAEADARLPDGQIAQYTQGMMDLGATICTTQAPACLLCPVAEDCVALREHRIAELPGKRAKRTARTQQVGMLVMLSCGEVMLEKRPAKGIWGGLWSLPEMQADEDPQAVASQRWDVTRAEIAALEPFRHAFTHYTLVVTPWRLDLRKPAARMEAPGATWMPLDALAGAALPAPVRALLTRVAAGAGTGAAPPSAAPRR